MKPTGCLSLFKNSFSADEREEHSTREKEGDTELAPMYQMRASEREHIGPIDTRFMVSLSAILACRDTARQEERQISMRTPPGSIDNALPVIPVDDIEHDPNNPLCHGDPSCPCHECPENIARVSQAHHDGLVTDEEATRIILGRNV